jgi:carboxyl-terminal processing protease
MTKRFQLVIVLLSTCVLTVLMLGTVLGQGTSSGDPYRHFAVFSEVISKIKSDYVEEPDMKNVALGALNGLLESVDPFASYLNAEQYKTYLRAKETRKAGVGLVLARRFGYVSVVDAIPGSPADKAALGTGDVLETIGGIGTRDMPLAYAEMLLLGDPGTNVDLTVLRVRRGTEAQKVALVRAAIKQPPVSSKMLPDGVGYILATSLEAGKSKEIGNQLAELQKQGAKKFVLDLRHNASGSVDEGIALADLFLEKGLITYLQGQKVQRQNFEAKVAGDWKQPVVVLVNRGTAGGAEVAALALLENKRAEVVGERTYGEAAQRKPLVMDDGSAVILAVAKYYGPAGKAIPDNAVTPSLVVADPNAAADSEDDDDAPAPAAPKKSDEDQQLKKAIEVLNVGLAGAKQSDRMRAERSAGTRKDGSGTADQPPLTLGPLNVPRPQ